MNNWMFPSISNGGVEGFSDAAIAEFKGHPLKALAREICQNSLDAADGSGRPVRVEFRKHYIKTKSFPGMDELKKVLLSCNEFWAVKGDANTKSFLDNSIRRIKEENTFVLTVSDYNTTGVIGAFDTDDNITAWGSLVKGNHFSVKSDTSNAAGSFGIGKAAPFATSAFQTIFYRTLDKTGVKATLGVSRLMSHNSIYPVDANENAIRRSVGYYGEDDNGMPSVTIPELDNIFERTECGTDIFIPGVSIGTGEDWIKEVLAEIVDNFLYSIYSGKLEVVVGEPNSSRRLNKDNLVNMLSFIGNKAKNAQQFYRAIDKSNSVVIEDEIVDFHGLGSVKLRLLYDIELNKKILVVRNSGMKIATIPSLPRGISFTGFLEICGDKLNEWFRGMENPKHNAWEPKRYDDPKKAEIAKRYKEEVEDWVRESISAKLVEQSGSESAVDLAGCLNYSDNNPEENNKDNKEVLVDTVKEIVVRQAETQKRKTNILVWGGNKAKSSNSKTRGTIDDEGGSPGHRRRTGKVSGHKPTGRMGVEDEFGQDEVYSGMKEVKISARIISKGNGLNKLIFTPHQDIINGEIKIVTKGENGKSLDVFVTTIIDTPNAYAKNGVIYVNNVGVGEKITVQFQISEKRTLALGVKAYGNKK